MLLGSKIREVRTSKEMTLKDVSERTGLTSSYLSQIERNITEPSISALRKVSVALEVPLAAFLTENNNINYTLIKNDERVSLKLPEINLVYEFLTPINSDKRISPKMEVITLSIPPKSWSSYNPIIYDCDTCIVATEGSIQIELNGETFILNEGDSIYIKSKSPNRLYNSSNSPVKAICIFETALF